MHVSKTFLALRAPNALQEAMDMVGYGNPVGPEERDVLLAAAAAHGGPIGDVERAAAALAAARSPAAADVARRAFWEALNALAERRPR